MGIFPQQATAFYSPAYLLGLILLISACHHDDFVPFHTQSPHFIQDMAYCEMLARSVESQYDPDSEALWFYKFGADSHIQLKNHRPTTDKPHTISHFVNHNAAADTHFVNFHALSLYDVAYQHQGLEAVISLCLHRKGYEGEKRHMEIAELTY